MQFLRGLRGASRRWFRSTTLSNSRRREGFARRAWPDDRHPAMREKVMFRKMVLTGKDRSVGKDQSAGKPCVALELSRQAFRWKIMRQNHSASTKTRSSMTRSSGVLLHTPQQGLPNVASIPTYRVQVPAVIFAPPERR